MGITFRHDAAAVALPTTNASGRKYGQSLVLQQNQQKYAAQQAGYERMYDAYKTTAQNVINQQRDWQQRDFALNRDKAQNDFMTARDKAQNDFVAARDKAQFDQQQKLIEDDRHRKFMDDARKQSSGMIMSDIQNGLYDDGTSRKLQQNLVAESEALGNPQLDATQRAEILEKIRAERATLTANRMEKPPAPTQQEQFEQGIVTDPSTGMRFRQNARGEYEPLPQKEQMPSTAQEYYNQNPDRFQKDFDSTLRALQSTSDKEVTNEAVWEEMQKRYAFQQKSLGLGTPTPAPASPVETPEAQGPMRSILEGTPTSAPQSPVAPAPEAPPQRSILEAPTLAPPMSSDVAPPRQDRSILEQPTSPQSQPPAQNNWADVASPQPAPESPNQAQQLGNASDYPWLRPPGQQPGMGKGSEPNSMSFGDITINPSDEKDRMVFGKLKGVYDQAKSPEIKNAIGILVNPKSSPADAAKAAAYLKNNGIDINQLVKPDFKNFSETNAVS